MSANLRDQIPQGPQWDFLRSELAHAESSDLPPRYLNAVAFGWMTADEAKDHYARERTAS